MKRFELSRVKTGIPGLDELLDGGIPKGNVVLLSGPAGSGKTIFGLQFIVKGAELYGENGVYVSFEENKKDIVEQALLFGWDLENLEKEGKIKVLCIGKEDVDFSSFLQQIFDDFRPQRFVLDSLSLYLMYLSTLIYTKEYLKAREKLLVETMLQISPELVMRKSVMDVINLLKKNGITSFLISELPEDAKSLSRDTYSEFLCDGIIVLRYFSIASGTFSNIEIRKMRKTEHKHGVYPVFITEEGMKVGKEEISGGE